jgi:hypothetical protein
VVRSVGMGGCTGSGDTDRERERTLMTSSICMLPSVPGLLPACQSENPRVSDPLRVKSPLASDPAISPVMLRPRLTGL